MSRLITRFHTGKMLFNSLNFIIFFPIVLFVNTLILVKYRYVWLFISSLFFYVCFDIRFLPVLIGVVAVTYFAGLILEISKDNKKATLIMTIGICLIVLGVFKYLAFFASNIIAILSKIHVSVAMPVVSLMLPVGISFFTFKSIGYVLDVYKGKIKAERNIVKYTLFVSFFPQIVAGPIDRADNLLSQINEDKHIKAEDIRYGALLMLWGYFEKLVIADRIGGIVDYVYNDHQSCSGAMIAFATFCYGIQIYTDFSGYSHLSIGAARILGFEVKDNFRQPYLATNIKDFWGRWHISMSTWFRDYVYIPLGGNRKGKLRKNLNNLITFLLSGLWHGSSWNFVAWGGLHGIYNVVSDLTANYRDKLSIKLKTDKSSFGYRLIRTILTFLMVDYAWMFFRADSLRIAISMTKSMLTDFRLYTLSREWVYSMGLSENAIRSVVPAMIVLFAVDVLHERGFSIIRWLDRQGVIFRWTCYVSSVFIIILAAIQNLGQNTSAFIYSQF